MISSFYIFLCRIREMDVKLLNRSSYKNFGEASKASVYFSDAQAYTLDATVRKNINIKAFVNEVFCLRKVTVSVTS
jgi:hypothetical protein